MPPTGAAIERAIRIHTGHLLGTLRGIPQEDFITWEPVAARDGGHEMNTFSVLAVHTVSAAEFHTPLASRRAWRSPGLSLRLRSRPNRPSLHKYIR